MHTLSCLHKLRRMREKVFVVTDDNVSWVLDEMCAYGPLRCNIEEHLRENITYASITLLAQHAEYYLSVSTLPC